MTMVAPPTTTEDGVTGRPAADADAPAAESKLMADS